MKNLTIREAIREAIDEEMSRNDRVFLIGEEVARYNGAYKISEGLWDKYGDDRIVDTPISESGFTGLSIGAAMLGLRPIVEFMSFNFSFVAFDQIVNNAFKTHYMSGGRFRVPIVFRGPNGAAASVSCQHSHNVDSTYAHFPGCKVVFPSTPFHCKGLLKSAIRDDNPIIFLENELLYPHRGDLPEDEYLFPIGKARVVSFGNKMTLISFGRSLTLCLEAISGKDGVEVIDLVTIKPIDLSTIVASVRKTGRVLIVEEGHRFGGISAELSALIQEHAFDYLDHPIVRVTQMETPLPYSPPLEKVSMPSVESISLAVEKVLKA